MMHSIAGAGLGFRRELVNELRRCDLASIDFFELAPENWIALGGRFEAVLREFTERFRFTCHGLSLSLGGTEPLDLGLLRQIRSFLDQHQISLYTEHLSWSAADGQLYDLLPVPFTEEAVSWIADRISVAQDILGRQIGIENASYYFRPPESTLTEAEFINAILAQCGCFLHLDVNNLYVNSSNLGYDPAAFLKSLDAGKVGYLHVAGHLREDDGWLIDTHGGAVCDPVWTLLGEVFTWLGTAGSMPATCLERDFNFPPIEALLSEVETIRRVYDAAAHSSPQARSPGADPLGSMRPKPSPIEFDQVHR